MGKLERLSIYGEAKVLLLGMGCKGRGQFPFLCIHVEENWVTPRGGQ